MTDEKAPLYAAAIIGKDAEQFMQSDLGQTILGMALQEAEEATSKLKQTSPWRKRRIQQLQNEIYRAESFGAWLQELCTAGQQALHQLEEDEE